MPHDPHDPDAVRHANSQFVPMQSIGAGSAGIPEEQLFPGKIIGRYPNFNTGPVVVYKTPDNVVPISGQPVEASPILSSEAQGIVDILRTALEIAERGQLTSIFIAYADQDGSPGGVFDGKPSSVTYAVSRLMRRFHRQIDEREGV